MNTERVPAAIAFELNYVVNATFRVGGYGAGQAHLDSWKSS
jgi:hypothetical protein